MMTTREKNPQNQSCNKKKEIFFFWPSPLPFGGSTVLRLTRGPARKRTTTGSLSAPSRTTPYQLSHEDTQQEEGDSVFCMSAIVSLGSVVFIVDVERVWLPG